MTSTERKVLFIAYYFPPLGMGGTQRVAKWCKYLSRDGWQTTVVTVKPISYYARDESLLRELHDTKIVRTGSLDPARVLYLLGKRKPQTIVTQGKRSNLLYWFLLPDPRILWFPFALWHAWREVRQQRIPVIVTSGPPHSSHFVGWLLSRLMKIRWISDFRDSWQRDDLKQTPTRWHRRIQQAMERLITRHAHALIAVSQGLAKQLEHTGKRARGTTHCLPNGYDPEAIPAPQKEPETRFEVTYVGTISSIQDPRPLLAGFRAFVDTAQLTADDTRLNLVGADLTGQLREWIKENDLAEFVNSTGYLPHREALAAQQTADVLIFLANPGTDPTIIPGKTFEYLAARKPVLAVGEKIEGMQLLMEHLPCRYCEFEAIDAISRSLLAFFKEFRDGALPVAEAAPLQFSREQQAKRLAVILRGL